MKFKKILKENILLEGTRYDEQAAKIISNSGLFDEETSKKIIDGLFKQDIHAFVHAPNWLEKYLKGIARMLVEECNGDNSKAKPFLEECYPIFNNYLTWVKDVRPKLDEKQQKAFDDNFINNLHYKDVKEKVDSIADELDKKSKEELSKMQFKDKSNYSLIPIDSFEEFNELYGGRATGDGSSDKAAGRGGTAWCHANGEDTYNTWTKGKKKFFVLQNDDWEDISFDEESNKKNPKDAYGNSLIALLISRNGKLLNATLRCNHVGVDSNADNQYNTYAELSKVAGFNVEEEVMKYYDNIEDDNVIANYFELENGVFRRLDEYEDEDNLDIEEIILPEETLEIADWTFNICHNLKSITFNKNLKRIGNSAFNYCTDLEEAYLPESLKVIGERAFKDCSNLYQLIIPNSVEVIGRCAFQSCDLSGGIALPANSNYLELEEYTFINSNLKAIILPNNIREIHRGAFYQCSYLTNINLSNVRRIEEKAFYDCESLLEIILPKALNYLGDSAFKNCKSLENVIFGKNMNLFVIPAQCFQRCVKLENVYIPKTIERIEEYAFSSCYSLKNVYIGNVKYIDDWAFVMSEDSLTIHTTSDYVERYCNKNDIKCVRISESDLEEAYNKNLKNYNVLKESNINNQINNKNSNLIENINNYNMLTRPTVNQPYERYWFAKTFKNENSKEPEIHKIAIQLQTDDISIVDEVLKEIIPYTYDRIRIFGSTNNLNNLKNDGYEMLSLNGKLNEAIKIIDLDYDNKVDNKVKKENIIVDIYYDRHERMYAVCLKDKSNGNILSDYDYVFTKKEAEITKQHMLNNIDKYIYDTYTIEENIKESYANNLNNRFLDYLKHPEKINLQKEINCVNTTAYNLLQSYEDNDIKNIKLCVGCISYDKNEDVTNAPITHFWLNVDGKDYAFNEPKNTYRIKKACLDIDKNKDLIKQVEQFLSLNESLKEEYTTPSKPKNIYDIKNGEATWSKDGAKWCYADSIAPYDSVENYALYYKTKMSCKDFLDLTTDGADKLEMGKIFAQSKLEPLDIDRFNKEGQPIFLRIEFSGNRTDIAKVISHEGRHRTFALWKSGVNYIDVILKCDTYGSTYNKYKPFDIKELTLIGEFNNVKVKVNNLVPMSYKNYKLLDESFDFDRRLLYKGDNYTKEVKPNCVRLYHQTNKNNVNSIIDNGLLTNKAKYYDNPGKCIWFTEEVPDAEHGDGWNFGNCLVEVDIPKKLIDGYDFRKVNDREYNCWFDIEPKYLNAIYLQTCYRTPIMRDFQNTKNIEKSIERFNNGELNDIEESLLNEDYDTFKNSLKFPLFIMRGIYVKSKKDIDLKNIGKSWTVNPNLFISTDVTLGDYIPANKCNYILSGYVNEDDIDWKETEERFYQFSDSYYIDEDDFDYDTELEIVLKNNVIPNNLKVESRKQFFSESLLNEVYPHKGESKKDFTKRFMSVTKDEYPDIKQRYAVCMSYWDRRNKKRKKNESLEYDPPYNAEQIKKNYGIELYNKLKKDEIHNWRMNTGIELIHKEPSKKELERIWKNWQLMSDEMKKESDKKSIELFGVDNKTNYERLIKEYNIDEANRKCSICGAQTYNVTGICDKCWEKSDEVVDNEL